MTIKLDNKGIPILVLIAIVLVIGYLVLRIIFNGGTPAITYELFAAILGFALTSLVTFLLLNKQTEAELRKEESIQFLNLKMNVYQELLKQLHDVISKRKIKKEDITELRLLNQQISFVASAEVLQAFNSFVKFFAIQTKKENLDDKIIDDLLDEMSKLTVFIRRDLFQADKKELNSKEIEHLILSSNDLLDV